jgi:hypothetical protein
MTESTSVEQRARDLVRAWYASQGPVYNCAPLIDAVAVALRDERRRAIEECAGVCDSIREAAERCELESYQQVILWMRNAARDMRALIEGEK